MNDRGKERIYEMSPEDRKVLRVTMLGGFSINYGESPILKWSSGATKVIQLLQIILLEGKDGISREELIHKLYEGEDLADPKAALRIAVFRLRRFLESAGIPADNLVMMQGGRISWNQEVVPLEVDVCFFEKAAVRTKRENLPEDKLQWGKKACSLYCGEFLPMSAGEEWVEVEKAKYQNLYFDCLRFTAEQMKQNGEYSELLVLVKRAAELYPFEEWLTLQIDCLIEMKRYQEAMEYYDRATDRMIREIGVEASQEMISHFRMLHDRICYEAQREGCLLEGLQEKEWENGAYFCSYTGFVDGFRIIRRVSERSGQKITLLRVGFVSNKRKKDAEEDKKTMDRLMEIIGGGLRRGDFYTRYSATQFLIMLVGAGPEECRVVENRVDEAWRREEISRHVSLNYAVRSPGPAKNAQQ